MSLEFSPTLPAGRQKDPIIISGTDSLQHSGREYVLLSEDQKLLAAYEIRYAVQVGSFRAASLLDGMLAVGHEDQFYLFDTVAHENRLTLSLEGYFGYLYVADNRFYVATASGLYCIDKTGHIVWHNDSLAIDGVVLEEWDGPHLVGSGDFDPPDGWEDFVLDKHTGQLIK